MNTNFFFASSFPGHFRLLNLEFEKGEKSLERGCFFVVLHFGYVDKKPKVMNSSSKLVKKLVL